MALRFLRALLPSWRFFDRTTAPPRLFLRSDAGAWTPLDAVPRPVLAPLFSPAANMHLAYHSVVTQLVDELGELELHTDAPGDGIERDPRVTSLVTYELVTRIAREHTTGARMQWKIVVDGEDYLTSPELARGEAAR